MIALKGKKFEIWNPQKKTMYLKKFAKKYNQIFSCKFNVDNNNSYLTKKLNGDDVDARLFDEKNTLNIQHTFAAHVNTKNVASITAKQKKKHTKTIYKSKNGVEIFSHIKTNDKKRWYKQLYSFQFCKSPPNQKTPKYH